MSINVILFSLGVCRRFGLTQDKVYIYVIIIIISICQSMNSTVLLGEHSKAPDIGLPNDSAVLKFCDSTTTLQNDIYKSI